MAAPLVPTLPAYLPLPAPHADLCLTTFLPTDAADQVRLFGDPRVYLFLVGPPFPYTPEMADGWVGGEQARWADGSVWPAPSVIRRIADLSLAAPPALLGCIDLSTAKFAHLADPAARARAVEANQRERDPGAKRWDIGFYVDPEIAGKGVMTAALTALLAHADARGLPRRNISISAFAHNLGSLKVQHRLGFRPRYFQRAAVSLPAAKREAAAARGLGPVDGARDEPFDLVLLFATEVGAVGSAEGLTEERGGEVAFVQRYEGQAGERLGGGAREHA